MKGVEGTGVIMVLNINTETERGKNYQRYEHLKQNSCIFPTVTPEYS